MAQTNPNSLHNTRTVDLGEVNTRTVDLGEVNMRAYYQGRSDGGGYIGIYTPKSVYLKFYYVVVLNDFEIAITS